MRLIILPFAVVDVAIGLDLTSFTFALVVHILAYVDGLVWEDELLVALKIVSILGYPFILRGKAGLFLQFKIGN